MRATFFLLNPLLFIRCSLETIILITDTVLNHPRIVGLPLLLLANKQDLPDSLTVEQIRANYEEWWQLRNQEHAHRLGKQRIDERRMASLDVIGVSAIDGLVFGHGSLLELLLFTC